MRILRLVTVSRSRNVPGRVLGLCVSFVTILLESVALSAGFGLGGERVDREIFEELDRDENAVRIHNKIGLRSA